MKGLKVVYMLLENIKTELLELDYNLKDYERLLVYINNIKFSELIEHAHNVDFNRDIDESYAGGILDFSFEIIDNNYFSFSVENINKDFNELAFTIYNYLWNRLETILEMSLSEF